jgi:hypothetical protein
MAGSNNIRKSFKCNKSDGKIGGILKWIT